MPTMSPERKRFKAEMKIQVFFISLKNQPFMTFARFKFNNNLHDMQRLSLCTDYHLVWMVFHIQVVFQAIFFICSTFYLMYYSILLILYSCCHSIHAESK